VRFICFLVTLMLTKERNEKDVEEEKGLAVKCMRDLLRSCGLFYSC